MHQMFRCREASVVALATDHRRMLARLAAAAFVIVVFVCHAPEGGALGPPDDHSPRQLVATYLVGPATTSATVGEHKHRLHETYSASGRGQHKQVQRKGPRNICQSTSTTAQMVGNKSPLRAPFFQRHHGRTSHQLDLKTYSGP